MLKNTSTSYGSVAIGLHWLMAMAIFGLFGLGVWMRGLGYYNAWYHKAPALHQDIGMLLLLLLLFRLVWRWANVNPLLIGAAWERRGGVIAHRMFYALMLVIMISGYLIPTSEGEGFDLFGWVYIPALLTLSPQQSDICGAIHKYAAWAIIGLALLHSIAAFKHHLINKDHTLLRMLGSKRRRI